MNIEIIKSALRELSDAEYQRRVWITGSPVELSSMNEATAALFNDAGLDEALEKNEIIFSSEIDAELRALRAKLRSSLKAQEAQGTEAVLATPNWHRIQSSAVNILRLLKSITDFMR